MKKKDRIKRSLERVNPDWEHAEGIRRMVKEGRAEIHTMKEFGEMLVKRWFGKVK